MRRTVIFIQARTGSTRLPGKVLKLACGKTLLELMMERVLAATTYDEVVVITTTKTEDDVIVELCNLKSWNCFRGSEQNVLERHYQAAVQYHATDVVKIPSDCPLIDPAVIDQVITYYYNNTYDYVSNLHPATFPDGNDVEIMTMDSMEKSYKGATKNFETEHTTPYIWNRPELFKLGNVAMEGENDLSLVYRLTLDHIEDYTLISTIFERLYDNGQIFAMQEIIDLLKSEPELLALNQKYIGVNWYQPYLSELNI